MFGEEEEEIQEEKEKQLLEWTAFNGRTQTDITKPILWEYRANNWWTKAWEVVWDIATWIAVNCSYCCSNCSNICKLQHYELLHCDFRSDD